ncbi:hypothetical protein Bbelb_312120 [Branchiostoma belcheri]|nr:hypothetical protein Bbelb_312120 [Branchiostoma belcheri]
MAYVPYYEYIVVGCGGVGSGAVYWLAKRAGKAVTADSGTPTAGTPSREDSRQRSPAVMKFSDDSSKVVGRQLSGSPRQLKVRIENSRQREVRVQFVTEHLKCSPRHPEAPVKLCIAQCALNKFLPKGRGFLNVSPDPPVDRITTFCQSKGSGEVSRARRVSNISRYLNRLLPLPRIGSPSGLRPSGDPTRGRAGVLGLEQFKLGHDNGGSQDHSRIIRLCYHDPRYTRIVRDTYRAWEEVERESGLQLVYKTGGLDFTLKGGPQEWLMEEYAKAMDAQGIPYDKAMEAKGIPYERLDGPEIRRRHGSHSSSWARPVGLYQADTGLVDAARGSQARPTSHSDSKPGFSWFRHEHSTITFFRYERLDGPEIRRRFPQFQVGAETLGLYQADTGLVDAARGNSAHIQLARAHGATVMDECAVLKIDRMKNGMTLVRTSKGDFRCRRVVVAAGAWINHVLRSVGAHIPVAVTQEQVTYFATPHVKEFTKERYPTWISHTPDYDFYGLPIHGNTGSKIGIDAGGPRVTPETRTYVPDPVREKACVDFLQKYIPRSLGPIMYSKTCLYTMTMDRHFVIDTLATKGWPDVIVCCGAGHAYKFASLLGKILSQLAIDGRTQYPIEDFTMNRPAVTDPNFKPVFYMGKAKPQDSPQAKL